MPQYESKSPEELRLEDYAVDAKEKGASGSELGFGSSVNSGWNLSPVLATGSSTGGGSFGSFGTGSTSKPSFGSFETGKTSSSFGSFTFETGSSTSSDSGFGLFVQTGSSSSGGSPFGSFAFGSSDSSSGFSSGKPNKSNGIGRAVQQECRDRSRMPSSA
eukprot:TRINITY_DN12219_c0_g1_i7.p1 TRINITY_DN12219_c0_g1~~TRINITY_DN12219_c0_g1_i7.p1  ORF type:complete len:160 (-),score=22.63 TRINITY_DN12219_c0_g1_i7:10-489(-)